MDDLLIGDVRLRAADGHEFDAAFARPAGTARGGLVVIQEAFGVTPYIRDVCRRFAGLGYASIAPCLYDRQQRGFVGSPGDPESGPRAASLRKGLVWADVMADVNAAIDAVMPYGRVGIVGYCMGGSVAWLAALEGRVVAASGYYGRDVVDFLDRRPRCPTILHYGTQDHLIPVADAERVRAAATGAAIYVYEAGHGFDCPTRPSFVEDAATLAQARTLGLFRTHIG